MKTRWAALVGAALMLAGCQKGPIVSDAWVRLPAVPGRPAAAYATIQSGGSADHVLVAVTSPAIARAELHESMAGHGGMMSMQPIDRVAIGRGVVTFAPGGRHVMLFGVSGDLRPGGTVPLTFRFADKEAVTVDAKLVGAGDPAP